MPMHVGMLYSALAGDRLRCGVCQWRCSVPPGGFGFCRMYRNVDGRLYSLNYAQTSSLAIDPIEKKPLYHFYPGSSVFSLGGWGCNFKCDGCQNWQISTVCEPQEWQRGREITPEAAVAMALREGCAGIAWTYNEPGVWFEYTLDSARLAREAGLYTVYVTNGYLTAEALDLIGPYLDAWRVDVKGFSDQVYRKLTGVTHWRGILEVAERAKSKWGMHVEVVTNVVPTLNDGDEQLRAIADWIRDALGELVPWHLTRFHPQHQMTEVQATPIDTLERALEIGRDAGLKFVYPGNVPGHDGENTICYSCGEMVVSRSGYHSRVLALDGSRCGSCGAELGFIGADGGD